MLRGHSGTRGATTWKKSFQLCLWDLPVPSSGAEVCALAPAPTPVASSRDPSQGAPLRPFSEIPPSLTAQVARGEYLGAPPEKAAGEPPEGLR